MSLNDVLFSYTLSTMNQGNDNLCLNRIVLNAKDDFPNIIFQVPLYFQVYMVFYSVNIGKVMEMKWTHFFQFNASASFPCLVLHYGSDQEEDPYRKGSRNLVCKCNELIEKYNYEHVLNPFIHSFIPSSSVCSSICPFAHPFLHPSIHSSIHRKGTIN